MYRGCEFFFCNVFELLQVIDERPHSGPGLEEQASLLYAWPQRPFSWPPLSASSLSAGAVLRVQDQALLRSSRSSSCSTRRCPPRRSGCPVGYRKFFPDHYEVSRLLAQKGRCPRLTHSYISNRCSHDSDCSLSTKYSKSFFMPRSAFCLWQGQMMSNSTD